MPFKLNNHPHYAKAVTYMTLLLFLLYMWKAVRCNYTHMLNITDKTTLLDWSGPRLCLFMLRCISLKQLNSLSKKRFHLFKWPNGCASNPGTRCPGFDFPVWQYFYVFSFVWLCLRLYCLFWSTILFMSWNIATLLAMLLVYFTYFNVCDQL